MINHPLKQLTTWKKYLTHHKKEVIKNVIFVGFFLAWSLYFYFLWHDMIVFDGASIRIGWIGVWGDWAMHFTQGSAFAYRSLWITEHPLLVGAPYSYPFIVNWISGILIRMGMEFFSAFVVPSYIYCLVFVFVLMLLYKTIFRSRGIAILATSIFLLNGGLGFAWYIQEVWNKPTLQSIFRSPTEFTHMSKVGVEWISVITSMMVPQRAFVFGFPIALLVLLLIYKQVVQERRVWNIFAFAGIGVLFGLLTIIHTHSFLAVGFILACWALCTLLQKEKGRHGFFQALYCWMVFSIVSLTIALPILFFFDRSTIAHTAQGTFIRWFPGWFVNSEGDHKGMNWLWWWILNWGLTLPAGIIGWFILPNKKKLFFIPFFLLFILLNLFLFQPYIWDNTKFLVWVSLGVSGLAAYMLWRMLVTKHYALRVLAIGLFIIMIFSGVLDAYYALDKTKHQWGMYSANDLLMVNYIRAATDRDDVFLTSDMHNNAISNLAGRKIIMGFRAWLWTYGMDYSTVERDVFEMFRAGQNVQMLLEKYHVKYVAFDNVVREQYKGNEEYFKLRYPVFYQGEGYTIYTIK